MLRTSLALFLAFSAAGAMAAEPVPVDAEAAGCERDHEQAGKTPAGADGSSAAARPGTPAPVRARHGRGTPRWHSLLPGMIR
jgi:hypothetical protein